MNFSQQDRRQPQARLVHLDLRKESNICAFGLCVEVPRIHVHAPLHMSFIAETVFININRKPLQEPGTCVHAPSRALIAEAFLTSACGTLRKQSAPPTRKTGLTRHPLRRRHCAGPQTQMALSAIGTQPPATPHLAKLSRKRLQLWPNGTSKATGLQLSCLGTTCLCAMALRTAHRR